MEEFAKKGAGGGGGGEGKEKKKLCYVPVNKRGKRVKKWVMYHRHEGQRTQKKILIEFLRRID